MLHTNWPTAASKLDSVSNTTDQCYSAPLCFSKENTQCSLFITCVMCILLVFTPTACENGYISLWKVPDGGLTEILDKPQGLLKGLIHCNLVSNFVPHFCSKWNHHCSSRTLWQTQHCEISPYVPGPTGISCVWLKSQIVGSQQTDRCHHTLWSHKAGLV